MYPLDDYIGDFRPTGELEKDVYTLLHNHDHDHTFTHVKAVAAKALELAQHFGGDADKAETAAWLHDISAIIPNDKRIEVARALDIEVLSVEEQLPMIIHQKLSAAISRYSFGVTDEEILSGVGCHTTLKANASLTDKLVFVADKIAWDQEGTPPYIAELNAGLERSIDKAALAYLEYLFEHATVLHPWAKEAREQLLGL